MARLLLLLLVAAGLYFLFRWLDRQPRRTQWQAIAVTAAVVLLLLVLTGRAHWLAAAVAAVLPFIRGLINLFGALPMIRRIFAGMNKPGGNEAPSGGGASTVQSRYLRMTLDHDSGDIDGEVLSGQYRGKRLSQLGLEAVLDLLHECRDDDESVALLQAYLDRVYEDEWRQRAGEDGRRRQEPPSSGSMSRDEALQVLGLEPGASEEDIIAAHRRLMQKLHPDRGGSAYLAARINQAKDILLRD